MICAAFQVDRLLFLEALEHLDDLVFRAELDVHLGDLALAAWYGFVQLHHALGGR